MGGFVGLRPFSCDTVEAVVMRQREHTTQTSANVLAVNCAKVVTMSRVVHFVFGDGLVVNLSHREEIRNLIASKPETVYPQCIENSISRAATKSTA